MSQNKPAETVGNPEIYESPDVRLADTVEDLPFNDELKEEPSKEKITKENKDDVDKTLRNILKRLDQNDTSDDQSLQNESLEDIKETPQQKLLRLQQEALAFQKYLTESSEAVNLPANEGISYLDALSDVQQKLSKLDEALGGSSSKTQTEGGTLLLSKLGQARKLLDNTENPDAVARLPELIYKNEVSHASELETRIKSLERLLGPEMSRPVDVPEFHNFGGNLARAHELMRLLADPSQLDYVTQRVKMINAELGHLSEIQESLVSEGQLLYYDDEIELNKQVDQLMELFDRLEPLVQQAPMLTARLKTMGSFHNEALDMGLVLGKLDCLVKATEDDANAALEKCKRVVNFSLNIANVL
ncbi:hypothetical protein DSO57_1018870 [Entomophthora muscae]|uniref:Uncharacterized protein n=1 Tax=Entomophthora muscae TaxID=34485 RepID=A0ACC2RIQ6_9FUNG|nr:hypothetical protein DSO57_1018870 [Entomophthora muscae]